MNLSPRSKQVIDALLKGDMLKIGDVLFGLYGNTQKQVLKILVDNFDSLQSETGEQQARELIDLFLKAEKLEQKDIQSPPDPQPQEEAKAASMPAEPNEWRLTGLQCESYRGSGPPGETIEFPFDRRSALIYGPNGSGKSSLIGAVVWALTGIAITDSTNTNVTEVPLLKPSSKGEKKGAKIREWPVAATLPENNPKSITEVCRVELELACSKNDRMLFIRRTLSDGLEVKQEESQEWGICSDLSDYGISPLDLQLSLIAPSMFGRVAIESAQNAGQLLSLMLGLDDVENIGKLAGAAARNRTALSNKTIKERASAWEDFLERIGRLHDGVKETSEARIILKNFTSKEKPSLEDIAAIGTNIKSHIEIANQSIGKALGLSKEKDSSDEKDHEDVKHVPESLAESLRAAVIELKKGVESFFPKLNSFNPALHWNGETGSDYSSQIASTNDALEIFLGNTRTSMKSRLEWMRKKHETGLKADLFLHASTFYQDETGDCPVCEETISNEEIKSNLRTFQNLDPSLRKEIDDYFRDLRHQLDKIISQKIQAIADQSPSECLLADLVALKSALGDDLAPTVQEYDAAITELAKELGPLETDSLDLLPSDAETEFVDSAAEFIEACCKSLKAVRLLEWADKHLAEINTQLSINLTEPKGDSLLSTLSKGINAAEDAGSLEIIRRTLATAYTSRKKIEAIDDEISTMERLKDALDPIKGLEKDALAVVKSEFENIKEDTLNNWDQLYPERTTGLSPANLFLEGTKERKVHAYLGQLDFEVPGQYFANAGLQRAIALSFFFALLKGHPNGLGFVVMDDSIISLDDDHRERWSGNILKPCMGLFQFIFATHQKDYLKYGGSIEFSDSLIVELNARTDGSRISWKPGHRLKRAEKLLNKSYDLVPNILRKYIEELLLTFETYCDTPFCKQYDLKKSIQRFGKLGSPLEHQQRDNIFAILSDPKLLPIVNAGSHGATDHEVKKSMVADQLKMLTKCDKIVGSTLITLENLRNHDLRRRPVQAGIVGFPAISIPANWNQPLALNHLGRAAAKGDSVLIDSAEEKKSFETIKLSPALVVGNTLDPVAKKGQWVLLCPDDVSITDGCLAAILTSAGRHLLRRVWSDGDDWLLESINPVKQVAVEREPIDQTALRKIMGVVYEPRQIIDKKIVSTGAEWQESDVLTPNHVSRFDVITVEGESLEPIAWKGQLVLIGAPTTVSTSTVSRGSLAVLQTKNADVGNVIKRIFQSGDNWILVSPNPVDPHAPLTVASSEIEHVYPFRGVIFETNEEFPI